MINYFALANYQPDFKQLTANMNTRKSTSQKKMLFPFFYCN